MAVVKTLMKRYQRQKSGKEVRVRMLNPGRTSHHSDCGGLGKGDHASTKDPEHQNSRSSQGHYCQTHALGSPVHQKLLCPLKAVPSQLPARPHPPTEDKEDLKAFLHPLGQVGTQWDLGCSLLKKAEFSKVQDCLKRNRKSSEITL